MSTLYELSNEYLALLEMADDPDIEEEVWKDTLEGLGGELEIKADAYACVISEISGKKTTLKKEIDRLTAMYKACGNAEDRMKRSLEQVMIATGKTKFETELHKFSIQKNAPSLIIDNEEAVPLEFLVIKQEVNKTAIKDAIKAGETFEFAHLESSESLRIR